MQCFFVFAVWLTGQVNWTHCKAGNLLWMKSTVREMLGVSILDSVSILYTRYSSFHGGSLLRMNMAASKGTDFNFVWRGEEEAKAELSPRGMTYPHGLVGQLCSLLSSVVSRGKSVCTWVAGKGLAFIPTLFFSYMQPVQCRRFAHLWRLTFFDFDSAASLLF